MPVFQRFNKKIGAWVKMDKLKSGRVKILNVKESMPTRPFKGVRRGK